MKTTHEIINNVIKVRAGRPFEDFYILILPRPDQDKNFREFILGRDRHGIYTYLFGISVENDADAIAYAENMGFSYIPLYIDEFE